VTFWLSPRLFASKFSEEKLWFSALARDRGLDLLILPVLPREMERAEAPKVLKNRG